MAGGPGSGASTGGRVAGGANGAGAVFDFANSGAFDLRATGRAAGALGATVAGRCGVKYTRVSGTGSRSTIGRVVAYSAATIIATCTEMLRNECIPVVV